MEEKFMNEAYKLAKKAYKKGEVPVGAIIVKENKIISKAYNKVEKKRCALMHAELIAIKKASKKLKNWRLNDCSIYVTLEPCEMCINAIKAARIKKIYFSTQKENKISNKVEFINLKYIKKETTELLKSFFKSKR